MTNSPIVFRNMSIILNTLLGQYHIICVTGPRQSGKTTLMHLRCNNYKYINLEVNEFKEFVELDPTGFLEKYNGKVILDEVQSSSKLFPSLQYHTDRRNKKGEYILSGSKNFVLRKEISESLAGRITILNLLPFSLAEIWPYLKTNTRNLTYLIQRGFYPRLFQDKKMSTRIFYSSYVKTYVEKDLRILLNVQNLRTFQQFIKLCATRVGSILNSNDLSNLLGVDNKTVSKWISVLETSYILHILPSYHQNYDKRILKKPKLYFNDTGLLCYLLGIHTHEELKSHPMYGHIFENFVLLELIKTDYNKRINPEIYYWRDSNHNEVDFIIEKDNHTLLVEVKSSERINSDDFSKLSMLSKLATANKQKIKSRLIYGGSETYMCEGHEVFSWLEFCKNK